MSNFSLIKNHHPALEIFRELLSVPTPSGREERLAQLVRDRIAAMGYRSETDSAGNVLVRFSGREPEAPLCVFAAHMDEIALVVTRVERSGRLCVERSGGLLPFRIGERPLSVVGDEGVITGVLSLDLPQTRVAGDGVEWKDARILTGLRFEQLQALGIRPGSTAVPVTEGRGPIVFGDEADPLFGAWTMDDRMGVVTLLRLLNEFCERKIEPRHPTIVAFTVREETGAQGAKVLARRENPEVFIAVDGSPVIFGSDLVADSRPVVWSRDSRCHYDQELIRKFIRDAGAAGTEMQVALQTGTTFSDASAVYDSGLAARVAVIGFARENRHGFEVARLSACDALLATLAKFVETGCG